ncbi:hypothetical protein BIV24_22730 [Streptomyces colonosanans]|uniref:Uncharacterized protein n=1 Tax=Streptomyces colonosanans TaxID=1428652 RepID=A0A1S2P3H2_9ACTN|nr:hypothetical protein BIV24_22730 [Streptomyces colonosanans]
MLGQGKIGQTLLTAWITKESLRNLHAPGSRAGPLAYPLPDGSPATSDTGITPRSANASRNTEAG